MEETPREPRRNWRSGRILGGRFMVVVGLLALGSLVAELGFHTSAQADAVLRWVDAGLALCFAAELLAAAIVHRRAALRSRWYEYVLLFLFIASLGVLRRLGGEHREVLELLRVSSFTKLYLAVLQFYILASLVLRFLRAHAQLLDRSIRPQVLLMGGFGALVVVGSALLLLPRCGAGRAIGPVDALFTATSAVCVTGLTVLDTGSDFSPLGQAVIATLFQIGGLGIVAFVAFSSILSGRRFSLPQVMALREVLNAPTLGEVRRHVLFTVLLMIVIETVGAVLLFCFASPPVTGTLAGLWWSVFHSISAFCNAGFGLQSDSLVGLRAHWVVNLCIMGLILLGGLGTPVLQDLGRVATGVARRVRWWRPRIRTRLPAPPRLRLQSKLTLITTGLLVLVGFGILLAVEWNHALGGMPLREKMLASLFQSVTTRTAGFNTLSVGDLQDASQVSMIGLMVIGASPVSTGGGIKTVTFCILLLTLRMLITGRDRVQLFGASIAPRMVYAAVSVFVVYVLAAFLGVLLLCVTDAGLPLKGKAFEVVSALSTVGLSTGITGKLSVAGRLVICLAMFVGRVGPLTIVMSVFQSRGADVSFQYPEERIILG